MMTNQQFDNTAMQMDTTSEISDYPLALLTNLPANTLPEATQNLLNKITTTNMWQEKRIGTLTKQVHQAVEDRQKLMDWYSRQEELNFKREQDILKREQDYKALHEQMRLQCETFNIQLMANQKILQQIHAEGAATQKATTQATHDAAQLAANLAVERVITYAQHQVTALTSQFAAQHEAILAGQRVAEQNATLAAHPTAQKSATMAADSVAQFGFTLKISHTSEQTTNPAGLPHQIVIPSDLPANDD